MAEDASAKPPSNVKLTVVAVCGLAILCALGSWQVYRLNWKNEFIRLIDQSIAADPVSLADVEAGIEHGFDVDWLRARASGTFRHDLERHVYALRDGRIGWNIVTPFETAGGLTVWVDRGFVPDNLKDAAQRPNPAPKSQITVTGLIRISKPGKTLFGPDNEPDRNRWYWWDLMAMTNSTGQALTSRVLPAFLEAQSEEPPAADPKPQPAERSGASLTNRHLQYALTWYGLALVLLVVYVAFVRSRRSGA